MTSLLCPACLEQGERLEDEQYRCTRPTCRVTTYQITYPPDRRQP